MIYSKKKDFGILIVCLAITGFLYSAGLNGGYFFDDAHVLQDNSFIKIKSLDSYSLLRAAYSFASGGRELSMLTFALNHYFFGESTWWLKFFNLIIHCLNGLGLYFLTHQLVARYRGNKSITPEKETRFTELIQYLPLFVSALWLVHPINLIPVLYISQRMTLLSAFFIVYGLIYYLWARAAIFSFTRKIVYLPLGIVAFTIIGFKCKENAALLPLFILSIELTILRFCSNQQTDKVIVGIFTGGILLVLMLITYKFWQQPDWITSGYSSRYFSLGERVLTQFRVLVFYLFQIIMPSNNHLTLWHDDFGLSTGLLSPITTIFSLLFLLGFAAVALFAIRRFPLISLGILWFFVSHAIESTVIPLELIHEHRNYLASFGALLGIVAFMTQALMNRIIVLQMLVFGMFLAFSAVLHERANIWANDFYHAEFDANAHPESSVANFELGKRYYIGAINGVEGASELAYSLLQKAASIDQYTITPELLLVIFSEHKDIEYNPQWIKSASQKLAKYPYMAPSKSALQALLKCLKRNDCNTPKEDVTRLFDIAFNSNDHNLLTTAAFYYTDVNIDHGLAEQAFEKALSNTSTASWVNLSNFLLHTNKKEKACSTYGKFKVINQNNQINDFILFEEKINYLENQLNACV